MAYKKQEGKAEKFYKLHHDGKLLMLPNIWEPLGALLLEDLGYPAVATASFATAWTNGHHDGEQIPLKELMPQLKRIADSVSVPVSVDFEKGFADNKKDLQGNIKTLIRAGIVGLNIEDTTPEGTLEPVEKQCDKIKQIKEAADKEGASLFVNARVDAYLQGDKLSSKEKLETCLKRGQAYKEAGADCIYPIVMSREGHIRTIVEQLDMPININTTPHMPRLETLIKIGVARVSLGPSLLKMAIQAMKNSAEDLLDYEGLDEIKENPVSTAYLEGMITKSQFNP